jgi:hypothetical protein
MLAHPGNKVCVPDVVHLCAYNAKSLLGFQANRAI